MKKENKHVKKFKENHLKPDESVIAWSVGYIGEMMGRGDNTQHNGVLILTNMRVAFYRKGMLGEVLEAIPLSGVTSVERISGVMNHTLNVYASGNNIKFKGIEKADNEAIAEGIENQQSEKQSTGSKSHHGTSEQGDAFEKIKKLAELKEMGVISEEEFNSKKSALLEGI